MNKKADNTDVIVQNPLINSSVEKMIQVIRDKQVLLDRDLATLYGVETKRINEQVKRNKERFPEDFCFLLTMEETKILRSQKGVRTNSWTQLEDAPCNSQRTFEDGKEGFRKGHPTNDEAGQPCCL